MKIEIAVYDHESAIDVAVQRVLDLVDIKAITQSDAPELQKERSRCEVTTDMGGSSGNVWPEASRSKLGVPGSNREMTFSGKCSIAIITPPNIETHSLYRAMVRNACATMCDSANFNFLKYHKLQKFKSVNVTYFREAAQGFYMTVLDFEVVWSIQADAIKIIIGNAVPTVAPKPVGSEIFLRNADSTTFRQLRCDFEGVVNVPYLSDQVQAEGNEKVLVKNETDGLYYELYWTNENSVPTFTFSDDPISDESFEKPVYIINDTDELVYELRCRFDGEPGANVPYLLPT